MAIRAREVCGVQSAPDLYTHLESLKVPSEHEGGDVVGFYGLGEGQRFPLSNLRSLLKESCPILVFDTEDAQFNPHCHALFRGCQDSSLFDVSLLLAVSFAANPAARWRDRGRFRTYYVNDPDPHGGFNFGSTLRPLLLACQAGNAELAKVLIKAGAEVEDDGNDGEGDAERDEDASVANRTRDTPLLLACGVRGVRSLKLAKILVEAGANVNAATNQGDTSLLLACEAGQIKLAKMLVGARADVNAANSQKNTPLLAAFGAGKLKLAEMLVSEGANVESVREDGAGILSLAIVSQQAELLKFALARGPKRLAYQDTMSVSEFYKAFVEALFDQVRIEGWLRDGGCTSRCLAGDVSALMTSCALELSIKKQLEDVRACICHSRYMLQDYSEEAGTMFGEKYAQHGKTAGEFRVIDVMNKREKHPCRCIYHAASAVESVCFSTDGKMALGQGDEVVVCDASTGFVQLTLRGHW